MESFIKEIRLSILTTLALALLLGGIYPFLIWGAAQVFFPQQAEGSLIGKDGAVRGSRLIGQLFTARRYFHARPSAAGKGYDGANSGGSNLGPLSQKFLDGVAQRASQYRDENGLSSDKLIPADAVTASGSGLDPHISPANALLQVPRVAVERGVSTTVLEGLIETYTEKPTFGFLGTERVNVLRLNTVLDEGMH